MENGTWLSRVVEIIQPVSVRADRLATAQPFAGLPRPDLELAAGLLRETLVARGTRMTVQGKPVDRLLLILDGQALVSADARPLRVASRGDFVGLAGMVRRERSNETTIALSPVRAFEVDLEGLRRMMGNRRLRVRLKAAASPGRHSSAAV